MKYYMHINKLACLLVGLICVCVLGLSVLPIQAAEDQNESYRFNLFGSIPDSVDYAKDITVEGRDIKFYSFKCVDVEKGYFEISMFAFSPFPFEIRQETGGVTKVSQFVSVDGFKIYYSSVWGFAGGNPLDWIVSGYPNVTTFDSYTGGFSELAKGIAQEMAAAGFYDYDDSEWATDRIHPDITDARFYDSDCFLVNPTMDYTKGTSALSGTLSTFMGIKLNNDFYSYSSRNMKYTFLWESVNTSFEADLYSSHMHIDIICNDQVYTFSDSDYLLSSGHIDLSLQDILSFLRDNGVEPVIESFYIRYTPFYKVDLKTYYGRSVRFFVKANSDGILSESLGDDLYGSDSDYSDSDIVSPGDLPVKIPGFTDDESYEFDFSYDADNMFKNFFNSLRSLISYCGQLPALINKVFSFLPGVYGDMIVIILAACFIMRLLGR